MSNKTLIIVAISKLLPYAIGKKKAYEEKQLIIQCVVLSDYKF